MKFLINAEMIHPKNIRFFVGYSGWSNGQLQEEMKFGSWVTADMDANYLFKMQANALWKDVMNEKGSAYSVIAQMPDSANWN